MSSTNSIHLRLAAADDLDELARLLGEDQQAGGEFEWRGFSPSQKLRQRHEETGLIDETHGLLVVDEGDGSVAGVVSWNQISHGPGPGPTCWNIGIVLFPQKRDQGIGTEAQRLLAEYLFAHTPVMRLQAGTDIDNLAEQRSLEKAGFTREGVLRKAQFRNREWRDIVLYSRLRDDPPQA